MADLDIRADEPQTQRARKRRYNRRIAAAPNIDECAIEDDGGNGLDESVDTGVQRDVGNAEGAEKCRGVVVNGYLVSATAI